MGHSKWLVTPSAQSRRTGAGGEGLRTVRGMSRTPPSCMVARYAAGRRVGALALGVALGVALLLAGPAGPVGGRSVAGAAPVPHLSAATESSWSGYTSAGFARSVSVAVTVPTVTCAPGENSAASIWAGIDGWTSGTVEQDGVEAACQGGHPAYWAWWEMFSGTDAQGPLAVAVHPGDAVRITVADVGSHKYTFTVTNTTTTVTRSTTQSQPTAEDNSGECIVEDPFGTGSQVPYANYGVVHVSACLVNGTPSASGTVVTGGTPIGAMGNTIQMTGTGGTAANAVPSPLVGGSAFTVTRSFAPATTNLPGPVTGIAALPDGTGYWLVNGAGAVSPHGLAGRYGAMAGRPLNSPIAHIVSSPTGRGYWMVAGDGGIFAFGDAGFFGSMGATRLNKPVVSLAPSATGRGYWLVASDGGIFAFGDAGFHGSMGGAPLNQPVVGMAADPATGGYWLVATDGGVFAFAAPFLGSTGGAPQASPINGIDMTDSGSGYRFLSSSGIVFSYGTAAARGYPTDVPGGRQFSGMDEDATTAGYWLLRTDGQVYAYNAPDLGSR